MTVKSDDRPNILVFDSGLGGLSIVGEIAKINLDAGLYYCADTAYFPYGEKSDVSLITRIPAIISQAAIACQADLVIIACNTASTLALNDVRDCVNVPVIGVVPAIKPAAALTKSGVIGLLATPNTVNRDYTQRLINDFAQGVKVVRHGAVGLAGAAETMLSGGGLDRAVIEASVQGLFEQEGGEQIDVVVLACTHYPHLQSQLAELAPRQVQWIDSGAAIARRAQSVLACHDKGKTGLVRAYTTGGNAGPTAHGLARWGFEAVVPLS